MIWITTILCFSKGSKKDNREKLDFIVDFVAVVVVVVVSECD